MSWNNCATSPMGTLERKDIQHRKTFDNNTKWTFLYFMCLFLLAGEARSSSGSTSKSIEINVSLPSTHILEAYPVTTKSGIESTTTKFETGVSDYFTDVVKGEGRDGVSSSATRLTGLDYQSSTTANAARGETKLSTSYRAEGQPRTGQFDKDTSGTTTRGDTSHQSDPSEESKIANTDAAALMTPSSAGTTEAGLYFTNTASLVSTTTGHEWQTLHHKQAHVTNCEVSKRAVPNADGKYAIKMMNKPHNKTTSVTPSFETSTCSIRKFVDSEFAVYLSFESASWEPFVRCQISVTLCNGGKGCLVPEVSITGNQNWRYQLYRLLENKKKNIDLEARLCSSFTVVIHYRIVLKALANRLPVLSSTLPNSGYVISPGFDDNKLYPASVNMNLSINVAPDHVILLSFLHFHLEQAPACRFDWFRLSCLNTSGNHPVWKKCGRQDIPLQVFRHSIALQFKSGLFVQTSGFKIMYTILPTSQEPQIVSTDDGLSLINCSVPHFDQFAHHFNCNLAVDCAGAEDEAHCLYTSPDCGPGFIEAGNKCYEYTRVRVNTSWSDAYSYCHRRNRTLVNPSDPAQWERFKDIMVRYGRKTSVVFTGLRTSQNSVAEVPSLYRDMWQWTDSTMALYANVTSKTRSMPLCSSFQAEFNQFHLTAVGCVQIFDARVVCEVSKTAFSRARFMLRPSLPKNNYSWVFRNASLAVASCPSGHVVRDFLACDQQSLCLNKHYEKTCDTKGVSAFKCEHNSQSVHYTLTCDFRIDCPDGSDEDFCHHPQCQEDRCRSGQCIASSHRCDGMQHCDDGSDENCPQVIQLGTLVPPPAVVLFDGRGGYSMQAFNDNDSCPDTHFRCVSSQYCLPLYVRCNGVYDCPDHEDEASCETFQCPGFFRCRGSTVCLHPHHLCDGDIQCPQHDDELLCDVHCPKRCMCQGLAFVCKKQISPADFPSLRYLDASGSGMKMGDFAHNVYLIYLSLANCHIADLLPMHLKNLRTLDLSYNLLTTLALDALLRLRNLKILYLIGNPLVTVLSFTSPKTTRSALKYINLSGTLLKTVNASIFSGFPEMRKLNLSSSRQLSSITEDGFKALSGLMKVDLRGCPQLESYPTDLLRDLTSLVAVYADDYRLCCEAALPPAFNRDSCHAPADDIASCEDLLRSVAFRVFLWVFAFLAVLGNAISFFSRFYLQNETFQSSFNVFVTNLSVADFLMGVYLTVIGVADQVYKGRYLWQGDAWKNSFACRSAGFFSLLSTEVSAFFIFLITLDRFLVLRFPFSKVHFSKKAALVACGVAWFAGFVLAVVPLLPMTSHWKFYSQTGICIPLPFFSGEDKFPGHSYSFGVMIVLNFVLFLLIAVGQIFIYTAVKLKTQVKKKTSRDVAIARRLTTIVLSDFLCWFPIGLLGLLAFTGTPIPTEVNVGVAIFVLPFNSALNPFLYTFNIVMEKRRKAVEARMLQRLEVRHVTEMSQLPGQLAVTKETALNQIEGWLGVRMITLSDLAARFDMAPRMHDVEPPPSGKTINDVS